MLKSMKMSKSGKASAAAKAAGPSSTPTSSTPSAPKSLFQPGADSPLISPPNRLSPLSNIAVGSPRTLAVLPQLPLSNAVAAEAASAHRSQQEALLQILHEQRSRDLLALAGSGRTASFPPPAPAPTPATSLASTGAALQSLLLQQRAREEDQQQLLMMARQGLAQQQQRNESALTMAILALQARQNGSR